MPVTPLSPIYEPGQCAEVLLCGFGWWRAAVKEVGFLGGLAVCRVVFADGVETIKRLDQMRPWNGQGTLF